MSSRYQILQPSDLERIQSFERGRLNTASGSGERSEPLFAEWTAPWRKESLEHYLPLGWSFSLQADDGELAGYFLAQPLLFFREQTQTLWVEHFSVGNVADAAELASVARGFARDKHLQTTIFFFANEAAKIFFSEAVRSAPLGESYYDLPNHSIAVNTTKMSTTRFA